MAEIDPVKFCTREINYNDVRQMLIDSPRDELICITGLRLALESGDKDLLNKVTEAEKLFSEKPHVVKKQVSICVKKKEGVVCEI